MGAGFGEATAFGGDKKNWGAYGDPNGFKDFPCAMRHISLCLVLKLDNWKVVSITDEQRHPVPYYNTDIWSVSTKKRLHCETEPSCPHYFVTIYRLGIKILSEERVSMIIDIIT